MIQSAHAHTTQLPNIVRFSGFQQFFAKQYWGENYFFEKTQKSETGGWRVIKTWILRFIFIHEMNLLMAKMRFLIFLKSKIGGEKRSEIQKKHKIVQNVPKKVKNEQFLDKSL